MLIELHCHTDASKDSLMQPATLLRSCRQRAVGLIAVTDHNTIAGALAVRALAPAMTIVGEEIMTTQGELLAYFVKEEVPRGLTPAETVTRLRAQGAIIAVAHPFDRVRHGAWRESDLAALLPQIDAVEVFNARCLFAADNARAADFARAHGLPGIVGSDAHSPIEVGWAALRGDMENTPAGFLAGLQSCEQVTRLSSPLIHFTSTFARLYKCLRRRWRHRS